MSKNFVQNAWFRSVSLSAYRLLARAQFWRSGPRIYVNSIPKAGTHLLSAELERFPDIQNSRMHIHVPVKDLLGEDGSLRDSATYASRVMRTTRQVRPGQFFTGHNFHAPELESEMLRSGIKCLFMSRDPRDILVSRLHYSIGLKRHPLHRMLVQELETDEQRFSLFVRGQPGPTFVQPMRSILLNFLGWIESPDTLSIRFEDLVGERGGGSVAAKKEALERIAKHCELRTDAIDRLASTRTKATPTLRKGRAFAWTESLPQSIVEMMETECGDLIKRMGYAHVNQTVA